MHVAWLTSVAVSLLVDRFQWEAFGIDVRIIRRENGESARLGGGVERVERCHPIIEVRTRVQHDLLFALAPVRDDTEKIGEQVDTVKLVALQDNASLSRRTAR